MLAVSTQPSLDRLEAGNVKRYAGPTQSARNERHGGPRAPGMRPRVRALRGSGSCAPAARPQRKERQCLIYTA
jgi:hypothetical protein